MYLINKIGNWLLADSNYPNLLVGVLGIFQLIAPNKFEFSFVALFLLLAIPIPLTLVVKLTGGIAIRKYRFQPYIFLARLALFFFFLLGLNPIWLQLFGKTIPYHISAGIGALLFGISGLVLAHPHKNTSLPLSTESH